MCCVPGAGQLHSTHRCPETGWVPSEAFGLQLNFYGNFGTETSARVPMGILWLFKSIDWTIMGSAKDNSAHSIHKLVHRERRRVTDERGKRGAWSMVLLIQMC